MTDRIIQGTYADFKFIKTRSVVQIIVEVPIEDADNAFGLLGMPSPGNEQWVAVALLQAPEGVSGKAPAAKPKQKWDDMPPSQQAGILCADPTFQVWIIDRAGDDERNPINEETAKQALYTDLCITTRKALDRYADDWVELVAKFRADTQGQAEVRG